MNGNRSRFCASERWQRRRGASAAPVVLAGALGFLLALHGQRPGATAGPAVGFAHGGNAAEVPLELAANAVFVPVQIGQGRAFSWLLDTGTANTTADAALASSSPKGQPTGPVVLHLPGLEIRANALEGRSYASLGPWYGQRVGGVLGDDVLHRLVVQLDYARRSIELYAPAAYRPPGHLEKLSVRWVDGLPAVHARLGLGGRTVEGDFVLNTGGDAAVVVSSGFLATAHMYPYRGKSIPATIFSAAAEQDVSLTRGDWLQIGHWRVIAPPVAIESAQPAAGGGRKGNGQKAGGGWIGGEVLRKFQVVLDFPHDRVMLAPNREFVLPIAVDASGLTVVASGARLDQYEIRAVRANSPAAAAGLAPGDRITWVDTDPASSLTLDELRDLLSRPGQSPVLVVERLGKERKIAMQLRSPF